ncbi:unnamed protein product [Caenorhabditis auriculariae]|uniref:Uncharacterized protein n=1 Tax=Caenorhabditis auriculariae TaxID=2777116 RepID=A0A8S1H795_9PELO|nr:unnamed protein product [Caenorhabditis auriculariae]
MQVSPIPNTVNAYQLTNNSWKVTSFGRFLDGLKDLFGRFKPTSFGNRERLLGEDFWRLRPSSEMAGAALPVANPA